MIAILITTLFLAPPDTLNLDQCYTEAVANYPLHRELGLQDKIESTKLAAIQSKYLPQISVSGDAVYNSDVPSFDGFPAAFAAPTISNDQYHVTLGAEQVLYDGGQRGRQSEIIRSETRQSQRQVDVELYALRERINEVYFGVLQLRAREEALSVLHEDISAQLERIRAQVDQGVALQSNADVLEVELLKVEQQQISSDAQRIAALGVLEQFLGREIDSTTVLTLPQPVLNTQTADRAARPEYALFESTKSTIEHQSDALVRANYPKLAAFGGLSYGRFPGLNMFENSFSPYYAFGLRLSWKLWDWKEKGRQRQTLAIQKTIVDTRRATFAKNIELKLQKQRAEIDRLVRIIGRDDEIITLRTRIVEQAKSQLENGVITATDYLIERNAAYQATLTRDEHIIELSRARIDILTTIGEKS